MAAVARDRDAADRLLGSPRARSECSRESPVWRDFDPFRNGSKCQETGYFRNSANNSDSTRLSTRHVTSGK